jgi:BirA family biotin operon repressor/biotin-[acetyl-CoA-carboxylase] ligase
MTRAIHRYDTIDSTMRRAAELAAEGCPSGTAFVAAEQTAGHGRYGRSWHSSPGDGLYVSVVLRPSVNQIALPVTTLTLGLATVAAIEQVTGIKCDLRWPNDVMFQDLKCAGILTELHGIAIIAGIGVNVNHPAFPDDISTLATSLFLATGRQHSVDQLLAALLPSIDDHIAILSADGPNAIIEAFSHASSYARGRRVIVDMARESISGVTAGLQADGFLVVTDSQGRRHTIVAGGVRPAP